MIDVFLILVFFIGYLLITVEHKTAVNKAAVALVMAAFCWVLITLKMQNQQIAIEELNSHLAAIAQIIVFILGAMTIVELIAAYDGFRIITDFIRVKNKRQLLFVVSFLTFFLSAVLDNMTTSIVMVTLLRKIIKDQKERMIFAGMIIVAANAGGAWSPIGDITTTMLWIGGQVTSLKLVTLLLLPAVVSLLVPLFYFSKGFASSPLVIVHEGPAAKVNGAKRVFALGLGALIFVPVLKGLTNLPPYMGIILGLGVMWVLTDLIHQERHYLRIPHILTKIDIASLLFFLGILLTVAALETAGILSHFAGWLDTHFANKDLIVSIFGALSAIVDNVPLTAATMGMYPLDTFPVDSKIWEMIAYCVGTGGSLLIIGSAAGVIVMGMEKITFSWYMRKLTLPVLAGYIAGIIVLLIGYSI